MDDEYFYDEPLAVADGGSVPRRDRVHFSKEGDFGTFYQQSSNDTNLKIKTFLSHRKYSRPFLVIFSYIRQRRSSYREGL